MRWEAAPQGESQYHHTVKFEVSLGSSSPACVSLHIREIGGQMLGRGLSCAWRGVEQQPWPPPAHTVVTPAVSPGITQCGGKMASGGEPQLYLANGLVFRRGGTDPWTVTYCSGAKPGRGPRADSAQGFPWSCPSVRPVSCPMARVLAQWPC